MRTVLCTGSLAIDDVVVSIVVLILLRLSRLRYNLSTFKKNGNFCLLSLKGRKNYKQWGYHLRTWIFSVCSSTHSHWCMQWMKPMLYLLIFERITRTDSLSDELSIRSIWKRTTSINSLYLLWKSHGYARDQR